MDTSYDRDHDMAGWKTPTRDYHVSQFQAQSSFSNTTPASHLSAPTKDLIGQRLVSVEPPILFNSDEYDYLPGHSDVDRIVRETHISNIPVTYRIKLRSGELQTVLPSELLILSNGQEALDKFRERSDLLDVDDPDKPGMYIREVSNYSTPSDLSEATSAASTEEESDLLEQDTRVKKRPRRATRLQDSYSAYLYDLTSDDENSQQDLASSSDDIITSAPSKSRRFRLRDRRQTLRAARRLTLRSATPLYTDSDNIRRKGTRFSTRQRNLPRKYLREKLEDEISECEEIPSQKNLFSVKETFHRLPLDDPFRARHINKCDTCYGNGDSEGKGSLVFCQGCTVAYHQACLGPRSRREHLVTKISDTQFILQCRRCIDVACVRNTTRPHQGCCDACGGQGPMSVPIKDRLTSRREQQLRQDNDYKDAVTPIGISRVNNVENLLFRCIACHRAFHFEHLPPLSDTTAFDTDVALLRFKEYSVNWQCPDCSLAPGEIDAIVAWRPKTPWSFASENSASATVERDKEYLIKWKGMSHYHDEWKPATWVWNVVSPSMRRAFFNSPNGQLPHMTSDEAIPEDFLRVDIVFDVQYADDSETGSQISKGGARKATEVAKIYAKYKGLPYEDTVWESPPDPAQAERWDDFRAAYEDWARRRHIRIPDQEALSRYLTSIRRRKFSSLALDSQPEIMTGGQIMEYQKDGINWLYYMWFKGKNAILADEMGLGKTIQAIGLFAALIQYHKCWPFLVVAPNSTCPNWRKEIKQWIPSACVVTYYGSSLSRRLAHDYEMFPVGGYDLRSHIVVTSYETMNDDTSRRILSRVPWAGAVIDEGQRLKNDKSQTYAAMSSIQFPFKVLLTGTPLQNNTRELFNILQFCDSSKNADALQAEYDVLSKENIRELHEMIRPFFLRRVKSQVLTSLPPAVQVIVPVSMSVVQKKLYKLILSKNSLLIKAIFQRGDGRSLRQTERHNLNNILTQLRKCLCHPFVYSKAIEERTPNAAAYHRQLVEAAGKFQLLQLMLPKLQQRGHRVLIFSQFLDNLDVVEDFLDGLGLQYCRLDGKVNSLTKQKQIDKFNAENSPYFAFLLSTRSGGVGINLASADTVIIMDPDFNPHQDIQALSRAHRIGQKSKVLVFRLMTRASAEEKILQIGRKKMALDHVLIDRMADDEDGGWDLESILRHGAQALFDNDDSGDIHYDSDAVDKLLNRSQEQQERALDKSDEGSELSFARVWANDSLEGQLQDSDNGSLQNPTLWEQILHEREVAAAEEARRKEEALGRGKRKRNTVDYATNVTDLSPENVDKVTKRQESDTEFGEEAAAAIMTETTSETGDYGGREETVSRPMKIAQPFRRVNPNDPQIMRASMNGDMEHAVPCYVCKEKHPVGLCRLRLAGVEHCGLCGIAHFGLRRICPHMRSEVQITRMLDALRRSNESPTLVKSVRKRLYAIRRRIQLAKKRQDERAALTMENTISTSAAGAAASQPLPSGPSPPYASTSGSISASVERRRPPLYPNGLSPFVSNVSSRISNIEVIDLTGDGMTGHYP